MRVSLKSSICLIAMLFAFASQGIAQTAPRDSIPQRFSDSRVQMPPRHLDDIPVGSAPGMSVRSPATLNVDSTSRLVLERMVLLEKKLDLMEKRLSQLEKGGK